MIKKLILCLFLHSMFYANEQIVHMQQAPPRVTNIDAAHVIRMPVTEPHQDPLMIEVQPCPPPDRYVLMSMGVVVFVMMLWIPTIMNRMTL